MGETYRTFAFAETADPEVPLVRVRTETLRPFVVRAIIDRRVLDEPGGDQLAQEMWHRLRENLLHQCEATHRLAHGDIEISTHEDAMRDAVVFVAKVQTRREEGIWWDIWAAIDEDGIWS